MTIAHVWLLVVFGATANANSHGEDTKYAPTIVVDNLVSKEQCVALGKRLTWPRESSYMCTGLNKAR